jgi:hypothetical protein
MLCSVREDFILSVRKKFCSLAFVLLEMPGKEMEETKRKFGRKRWMEQRRIREVRLQRLSKEPSRRVRGVGDFPNTREDRVQDHKFNIHIPKSEESKRLYCCVCRTVPSIHAILRKVHPWKPMESQCRRIQSQCPFPQHQKPPSSTYREGRVSSTSPSSSWHP